MAKKEKPAQEITEEENVITPQEFEELEKKERKGKAGLFLKKPDQRIRETDAGPSRRKPRGSEDIDDLVVGIEKIEAKLETMEELRQTNEERISRISEEIGELRSTILEKEKTFNQVEAGFEKVREIFQELQPKKIRMELDKKEESIEKLGARVESFDTRIGEMKKNIAEIVAVMEKIKDLKNVIAISEGITKKMAKMEEERKETSKIAAKVESMFSELTEKMAEFHSYRDKIDFSSESMHDIMKSLDMLEVKVENALPKDEMKKMDDRIEQTESDLSDKIKIIRDIVDDLVTDLKKGGVKGLLQKEGRTRMDEINKKFSSIHTFEKSLKDLKDEVAGLREEKKKEMGALVSQIQGLKGESQAPEKKPSPKAQEARKPAREDPPQTHAEQPDPHQETQEDDMDSLLERCNAQIDTGNIGEAKRLYSEILSIYEQGRESPGAQESYGRIKRLYYRLQVHA